MEEDGFLEGILATYAEGMSLSEAFDLLDGREGGPGGGTRMAEKANKQRYPDVRNGEQPAAQKLFNDIIESLEKEFGERIEVALLKKWQTDDGRKVSAKISIAPKEREAGDAEGEGEADEEPVPTAGATVNARRIFGVLADFDDDLIGFYLSHSKESKRQAYIVDLTARGEEATPATEPDEPAQTAPEIEFDYLIDRLWKRDDGSKEAWLTALNIAKTMNGSYFSGMALHKRVQYCCNAWLAEKAFFNAYQSVDWGPDKEGHGKLKKSHKKGPDFYMKMNVFGQNVDATVELKCFNGEDSKNDNVRYRSDSFHNAAFVVWYNLSNGEWSAFSNGLSAENKNISLGKEPAVNAIDISCDGVEGGTNVENYYNGDELLMPKVALFGQKQG